MPEYQRLSFDKLDEVAEPMLRDMQTVRTSLSNRFTQAHTWKMSILIGIASFIISMLLHFFLNYYLVHMYGKHSKFNTKFTKHFEKNDLGQKTLSRQKRGPAMLAFGALTAVTAGAGIACSLGSIFGSCGGTNQKTLTML